MGRGEGGLGLKKEASREKCGRGKGMFYSILVFHVRDINTLF